MPLDEAGYYYHDFEDLPIIPEEEEEEEEETSSQPLPDTHHVSVRPLSKSRPASLPDGNSELDPTPHSPNQVKTANQTSTNKMPVSETTDLPNAAAAQAAMKPLFTPADGQTYAKRRPLSRPRARSSAPGERLKRHSICALWDKMFRRRSKTMV